MSSVSKRPRERDVRDRLAKLRNQRFRLRRGRLRRSPSDSVTDCTRVATTAAQIPFLVLESSGTLRTLIDRAGRLRAASGAEGRRFESRRGHRRGH